MPLVKSSSKSAVSENIRKMMREGKRPRKQIIAIALETARKSRRKGKR